eukprot:4876507-Pyramimonas_sp.AAC.1
MPQLQRQDYYSAAASIVQYYYWLSTNRATTTAPQFENTTTLLRHPLQMIVQHYSYEYFIRVLLLGTASTAPLLHQYSTTLH